MNPVLRAAQPTTSIEPAPADLSKEIADEKIPSASSLQPTHTTTTSIESVPVDLSKEIPYEKILSASSSSSQQSARLLLLSLFPEDDNEESSREKEGKDNTRGGEKEKATKFSAKVKIDEEEEDISSSKPSGNKEKEEKSNDDDGGNNSSKPSENREMKKKRDEREEEGNNSSEPRERNSCLNPKQEKKEGGIQITEPVRLAVSRWNFSNKAELERMRIPEMSDRWVMDNFFTGGHRIIWFKRRRAIGYNKGRTIRTAQPIVDEIAGKYWMDVCYIDKRSPDLRICVCRPNSKAAVTAIAAATTTTDDTNAVISPYPYHDRDAAACVPCRNLVAEINNNLCGRLLRRPSSPQYDPGSPQYEPGSPHHTFDNSDVWRVLHASTCLLHGSACPLPSPTFVCRGYGAPPVYLVRRREEQEATDTTCCICEESTSFKIPFTRGCSCEACPNCLVSYVVNSGQNPSCLFPIYCMCLKKIDAMNSISSKNSSENMIAAPSEKKIHLDDVPDSTQMHPTDMNHELPDATRLLIDPYFLRFAIEVCSENKNSDLAKLYLRKQLDGIKEKFGEIMPTTSSSSSSSSSTIPVVAAAGNCPICPNGIGINLIKTHFARCMSADCATLYCVTCRQAVDQRHIVNGCPVAKQVTENMEMKTIADNKLLQSCKDIKFKQCPICGRNVIHYFMHGCHIIPCVGHKWCYCCGKSSSFKCNCELYCPSDRSCNCPICPDCSATRKCACYNGARDTSLEQQMAEKRT